MKNLLLFIVLLFFNCCLFSQPLTLDQNFILNYNFDSGKEILGICKSYNNKIFCYGQFSTFANLNFRNGVLIDTSGTVDSNFFINPIVSNAISYADTTNGSILLHTVGEGYRKIDLNGNDIDPNFQSNISTYLPSAIINMSLESYSTNDNKLISGCTPNPCTYPISNPTDTFFIFRLLPSGLLDTTFNHDSNGPITYIKAYSDSQIFITGNFTQYDSQTVNKIVKVNSNFEIDTTFSSIFLWGDVYPAYLENDNKIIITGQFLVQGIQDTLGIVRLLSNGQLDSTFNNDAVIINSQNGLGFNTSVHSVCKTTDNGYLIGGVFDEYDGFSRGSIVKTDSNGNIDLAFLNGSGFDSHPYPSLGLFPSVSDIELGSDNKYYVSGWFNGYNGVSVQPIIRLNGLLTSEEEIDEKNPTLLIAPNPANGFIFLTTINCTKIDVMSISVINTLNQEVLNTEISKDNGRIDISKLPNGLYFIHCISNMYRISSKFVKIN